MMARLEAPFAPGRINGALVSCALVLFAAQIHTAALPASADELHFDARRLFELAVTQDVCLSADGKSIGLEQGELFEDDGPAAGYSYTRNEETLGSAVRIKKELLIPNPAAARATLLIGAGGDLEAEINGKPGMLKLLGKSGGYWQAYAISPDALRPGKNEFVLFGSGKVWIARDADFAAGDRARTSHPNRSAKSRDGGKTWDNEHLGTADDLDGEYYVRLFLDHHRPRGSITLPVVDAANLSNLPIAPPISSVGAIRVSLVSEANGGQTMVRTRTGTTRTPNEKNWSPWRELGKVGGTLEATSGRFVQIAVDVFATDPLRSPLITRLKVEAAPHRTTDWTKTVRIIERRNEQVIRTSIPFEYEPLDHARLKSLREENQLDAVAKGAEREFDLITRLAAWSATRFEKGHLSEGYPPWDALEILKLHSDGRPVGGFCQQYNLVFLQACESFGLVGRAVSIGPGDYALRIRGGHEVVEIWSNEHQKWVYVDGQAAWYFVDGKTRVPLSLLELRGRQLNALRDEAFSPTELVQIIETSQRWNGLTSWPPFVELRLIPRSSFLSQKNPLPLNQGMRGWFWTGHYVWTDAAAPAALLYGHRVSKMHNWNWTLNQADFRLVALERPGEIQVYFDTQTPSLATFVARQGSQEPRAVESEFRWQLERGQNRLEVWPRNSAGRDGISSRIVLSYDP